MTHLRQRIQEDLRGLIAGEVKISAGDADIPAYRAAPAAGGPFPTVVVVHEVFGVHEHIKDVCRRWARLGYYAIAPELFARQGDAAREPDMAKIMAEIVAKTPDAEVAGDLDAALAADALASAGRLQHDAGLAHAHFGHQPLEPFPIGGACS